MNYIRQNNATYVNTTKKIIEDMVFVSAKSFGYVNESRSGDSNIRQ